MSFTVGNSDNSNRGNVYNNINNNTFGYSNTDSITTNDIWTSYQDRMAIYGQYKEKTGSSIFSSQEPQGTDTAYNYSNSNQGKNSPVASVYVVNTDATYSKTNNKTEETVCKNKGQIAINGNDVPIGNTFIAYLNNSNENTTAFIGNTDASGLAENFFQSTDDISMIDAPNVQRTPDGQKYVAHNVDPSIKETKLIDTNDKDINPGNGVLNETELAIAQDAYTFEAKALTAATAIDKVAGDSKSRITSASTVDIDKNESGNSIEDYNKFFNRAGMLDGQSGVTQEELTQAIEQISDRQDNGLFFNKEKLNRFINGNNIASND